MELEVTGENFDDAPRWWKNFVHSFRLNRKTTYLTPGHERLILMKEHLQSEYKAVMLYNDIGFYAIKFNDPKYSTKFLLDWS